MSGIEKWREVAAVLTLDVSEQRHPTLYVFAKLLVPANAASGHASLECCRPFAG